MPSVGLDDPTIAAILGKAVPCVCWLMLDTCGPCKRFRGVWEELCRWPPVAARCVLAHAECSDHRDDALALMAPRKSFPAVVVFTPNGTRTALDVDSGTPLKVLRRRVEAALEGGGASAKGSAMDEEEDDDDVESPIERLQMVVEEDDDDDDLADEGPPMVVDDDDGAATTCSSAGCAARKPPERRDGTPRVTHPVDPSGVAELIDASDDVNRTCILYYADWCGHCKSFTPVWDECVGACADPRIRWCAVNESDDGAKELMEAHAVEGFPTVRLHHTYSQTYTGARVKDALLDFVTNTRKDAIFRSVLMYRRGW